jgi:hypothetical protein
MPLEIAGLQFTGFPGRDSSNLRLLDYNHRIQWLRYRFSLVFLTPFNELRKLESPDCYVWLCILNLLCAAVEALSKFEFRGSDRNCFVGFVAKYFNPQFTRSALNLHDPGSRYARAVTPAEHLYKYFRSGLAHSFCIEWGGILHREDGAPGYLFEANSGLGPEKALGVVPRELVTDFLSATDRFFQRLEASDPYDPLAVCFTQRFEEVFLKKSGPPVP